MRGNNIPHLQIFVLCKFNLAPIHYTVQLLHLENEIKAWSCDGFAFAVSTIQILKNLF